MRKFALVLASSMLLASSGYAADLGVISQPAPQEFLPVSSFSWTGFYAGVNGGYASGVVTPNNSDELDVDGGIFGAQIGYNQDLGGFVLGAEADVQWSGVEGSGPTGFGTDASAELNSFGTVRARAGVALDRALIYGTGGFAWGSLTGSSSFGPGYTDDLTTTGYAVGAGVEFALTDNVTVKGEYLYTAFEDQPIFEDTPVAGEADFSFHTVRAGVKFNF